MFDYEWATLQHSADCRLANRVLVPDAIPPEYAQRRRRLAAAIGDGVAVIPTAPERLRNRDSHYPYRFDSHFHHLTGFAEDEDPHFLSTISQPGGEIGTMAGTPAAVATTRAASGPKAGPATGGSGKSNRINSPATRMRTARASLDSRGR